jgi:hypothetical protein
MKKILTLLAVVGLFAFSGCSNDNDVDNDTIPQAFEVKNVSLTRITNNHYEYANNFKPFVGGDLFNDETLLIYRLTDLTNSGAPVWQLIPKTTNYDNGDVADYFFDFSKEDFVITVIASFNLATQTDLINNQTFRVVIVPSVLASTLNKNNYLDVMKTLKLKESEIKNINF